MARRKRMKHEVEYPHASSYRDKNGKLRWRVRRKGRGVELGADYGSPEFKQRYQDACLQFGLTAAPRSNVGPNIDNPVTVSDFVAYFYSLPAFKDLDPITKKNYGRQLNMFVKDRGTLPLAVMQRLHLQKYLDGIENPGAANMMLKVLKTFLNAMAGRHRAIVNVALGIKKRMVDESIHCWSENEIAAYDKKHAKDSVAWRAKTLILWTGAARVDAVELGPKNVYIGPDGERRLSYRRNKSAVTADMPLSAELAEMIDALPAGAETFLQTEQGKKRSANGLGNLIGDACEAAGISHCSAHGLRKALGRRLAQAGATSLQIMAVLGHKSLAEAECYTRAYQREQAATEGSGNSRKSTSSVSGSLRRPAHDRSE